LLVWQPKMDIVFHSQMGVVDSIMAEKSVGREMWS